MFKLRAIKRCACVWGGGGVGWGGGGARHNGALRRAGFGAVYMQSRHAGNMFWGSWEAVKSPRGGWVAPLDGAGAGIKDVVAIWAQYAKKG